LLGELPGTSGQVVVDERHVYWLITEPLPTTIYRISKSGGTPEFVSKLPNSPLAVTADAEAIYVTATSPDGNHVLKVCKPL
jgi:hypothetical protein